MSFSIDRIVPPAADRKRAVEAQKARIADLRRRAAAAAGGAMTCFEAPGLDLNVQEAFWTRVVAIEEAQSRPVLHRLRAAGIDVPPAAELDDEALHRALWTVIHQLAEWRIFVWHTNHLGDRELYTLLREQALTDPEKEIPPELNYSLSIDMTDFAPDEQYNQTYLRYYADETERAMWADSFPEDGMPPHEDPPYDRDASLPAPPEID
jgi:hypothetical protein